MHLLFNSLSSLPLVFRCLSRTDNVAQAETLAFGGEREYSKSFTTKVLLCIDVATPSYVLSRYPLILPPEYTYNIAVEHDYMREDTTRSIRTVAVNSQGHLRIVHLDASYLVQSDVDQEEPFSSQRIARNVAFTGCIPVSRCFSK